MPYNHIYATYMTKWRIINNNAREHKEVPMVKESITIIPFTVKGELVLIRRYDPITTEYVWDFPNRKLANRNTDKMEISNLLKESGIQLERVLTEFTNDSADYDNINKRTMICKVSILESKSNDKAEKEKTTPYVLTHEQALELLDVKSTKISDNCKFFILGLHLFSSIDLLLQF